MKEKIIDYIENNPGFIKNNGFKVKELNEEKCILEYNIKKDGLNPMGIVHGGVLFGLDDTAAGVLSSLGGIEQVTTNSSMNYIRPATKGKIYAVATKLKVGKSIGYFEVKIYDSSDNLLATSFVNMFYKNKKIS